MTPDGDHREKSGANFYTRVEGQLNVIEADVKTLLERTARLEERITHVEHTQETGGSRTWEIIKHILTALISAAITGAIAFKTIKT